MAKPLTHKELGRLFQLNDEGTSYKEMADVICREFGRETLDRTTIYRKLKSRLNRKKAAKITESFCDRGYHSWVLEPLVSRTKIPSANGEGAAGYLVNTGTRKTCRDRGQFEETSVQIGEHKRVAPIRTKFVRPPTTLF